ncbi:hypothetical protein Tco_0946461 [Tanacetum coccineum]
MVYCGWPWVSASWAALGMIHTAYSNPLNTAYRSSDTAAKIIAKMKVIKEEFKKLGLLKINDDSFACNTPLGTIFNEFNRLSGMDDDLFTYEVEIPGLSSIPCDKKEGDGLDNGDLDIYKPRVDIKVKEGVFSKWLVRSYKKQFDEYMEIKKQWVTRGIDADMEYDPSDVEFSKWLASKFYNHMTMDRYTKNSLWIYWTRGDDEVELTDEEFPDPDDENLINKGEAYDEFKNEWMDEWNKGIPWVPEEPWAENGIPIDNIHHICEPLHFTNGKAKWPTCNSNDEGFCNGGELSRMDNASYHANDEEYEEDRCELLGNPRQEPPVSKMKRFEMIKYSFGPAEKYAAIKECEYDDLTRTEDDACHAYQEIFRIMGKGWIKSESISKKKKSNYSSFQDLRLSCNEDMVKYEGPRPSTTRARTLNEKCNKKIPPATSQPPGWRVCRPAEQCAARQEVVPPGSWSPCFSFHSRRNLNNQEGSRPSKPTLDTHLGPGTDKKL